MAQALVAIDGSKFKGVNTGVRTTPCALTPAHLSTPLPTVQETFIAFACALSGLSDLVVATREEDERARE